MSASIRPISLILPLLGLLLGCGEGADPASPSSDPQTPASASSSGAASAELSALGDAERVEAWWERAQATLLEVENPPLRQWARCQLALALHTLERTDEALALLDETRPDGLIVFVLQRMALLSWRDGDSARFASLADRVAELTPELGNPTERRYHSGMLFVFEVTRGRIDRAETAWLVARQAPEMTDELRKEFRLAQLGLLATLGREEAWRTLWSELYEKEAELADMAALLRGMLYAGDAERVATWLEGSLEGAVGAGATVEFEELTLGQRLLLDWIADGFAVECLPIWDRLSTRADWPEEIAPPVALLSAFAAAGRMEEAEALLSRMQGDARTLGVRTLAVAWERADEVETADELLARFEIAETPGLRLRRLLDRAERREDRALLSEALELFLTHRLELPAGDGDLLGELVRQLHEADALDDLQRVATEMEPGLGAAPEALSTLAALRASTRRDAASWQLAQELYTERPELRATFAAQAAIVCQDGPLAELPSTDLSLRPDQVASAYANGLREARER